MAKELKNVDITNKVELLQIVEQVQSANQALVLSKGGEDVAIVRPVKRPSGPPIPRGKPFTKDDPLWDLAGAGASGLGDVSENKHKYLAEAYLAHARTA
ncbi:MAG: hypothetical protein Q8O86_08310 [Dehalococcoidia bacterium]|nr:hypothetical protein [Dehalococcoidia bacterium]